MKDRHITIFIALAIIFSLLVTVSFAQEEEEGKGTVVVRKIDSEEIIQELTKAETVPFIPDNLDVQELAGTESGPVAPDDYEKTIFGSDDRITVKNTSSFPYSAIAYMEVKGECGCSWTCTGFMVNKDRLLTAAHCLVCTDHSKWADRITFYFGYKNKNNYAYKYTGGWNAWVGDIFSDKEYSSDWDYGCMKLDKNVGDSVGWFGSWWGLSDSQLSSTYAYIAGYRDGLLKYDSGWIEPKDSRHITYRIDTVPGNSGGPIYTSDYYAIGINIANNGIYNIGFRLTNTVKGDLDDL